MSDEVCQCEKCQEWRAEVARLEAEAEQEEKDIDLDGMADELDEEAELSEEFQDDGGGGGEMVEVSRAAEDQSEFPETLYVEWEADDDGDVFFTPHTTTDLLSDGDLVGVYRLVDVKTVKRTVELE